MGDRRSRVVFGVAALALACRWENVTEESAVSNSPADAEVDESLEAPYTSAASNASSRDSQSGGASASPTESVDLDVDVAPSEAAESGACDILAPWSRKMPLGEVVDVIVGDDGTLYALSRVGGVAGFDVALWRSSGGQLVPLIARHSLERDGRRWVADLDGDGAGLALEASQSDGGELSLRLVNAETGEEIPSQTGVGADLEAYDLAPLIAPPELVYRTAEFLEQPSGDLTRGQQLVLVRPPTPFEVEDVRVFHSSESNALSELALIDVVEESATARWPAMTELIYAHPGGGSLSYEIETDWMRPSSHSPSLSDGPVGAISTTPLALSQLSFDCSTSSSGGAWQVVERPAPPPRSMSCAAPLPLHVCLSSPLTVRERFGVSSTELVGSVVSVVQGGGSDDENCGTHLSRFEGARERGLMPEAQLWTVEIDTGDSTSILTVGSPGPALPLSVGHSVDVRFDNAAEAWAANSYSLIVRGEAGELLLWMERGRNQEASLELPELSWTRGNETCATSRWCFAGVSQYALDVTVEGESTSVPYGGDALVGDFVVVHGEYEEETGSAYCLDLGANKRETSLWRTSRR